LYTETPSEDWLEIAKEDTLRELTPAKVRTFTLQRRFRKQIAIYQRDIANETVLYKKQISQLQDIIIAMKNEQIAVKSAKIADQDEAIRKLHKRNTYYIIALIVLLVVIFRNQIGGLFRWYLLIRLRNSYPF
jgi:hypothetical protein